MELEECLGLPYNLIPLPLSCVQCWGGKERSSYSLVLPHGSGAISKAITCQRAVSPLIMPSCSYCLI